MTPPAAGKNKAPHPKTGRIFARYHLDLPGEGLSLPDTLFSLNAGASPEITCVKVTS